MKKLILIATLLGGFFTMEAETTTTSSAPKLKMKNKKYKHSKHEKKTNKKQTTAQTSPMREAGKGNSGCRKRTNKHKKNAKIKDGEAESMTMKEKKI